MKYFWAVVFGRALLLSPEDKATRKLRVLEKLPLPPSFHNEIEKLKNAFMAHDAAALAEFSTWEKRLRKFQRRLGLCRRLLGHLSDDAPEELRVALRDPTCPTATVEMAQKYLEEKSRELEAKQEQLGKEIEDGKLNILSNLLRRREHLPLVSQKAVCTRDMFRSLPHCGVLLKVTSGSLYDALVHMAGAHIQQVRPIAKKKNDSSIVSSRMVNSVRRMVTSAEDAMKRLEGHPGADMYIHRIEACLGEVRAHPHDVKQNLASLTELMKTLTVY